MRATNLPVIAVVGEALIDLVVSRDGSVEAALGGAPYNTARAAARLGAEVEFVGGLSRDRFGQLLADKLNDDGVGLGHSPRTESPSTLAVAEIGDGGAASYRFYFDGTAAPQLDPAAFTAATATLGAGDIFFTGGLGLVLEPMATSVTDGLRSLDDDVFVMIDVNCRPAVVDDREAYIERVRRAVSRADLVKVSDEDLTFLSPGDDLESAAGALLAAGAGAVVVTAGSSHTTVVTAAGTVVVDVPAVPGSVVDTIGAGDTFGAGTLAWLHAAGVGRGELPLDRLVAAVQVGHAAAGVVVTRRGSDPPFRTELDVAWP